MRWSLHFNSLPEIKLTTVIKLSNDQISVIKFYKKTMKKFLFRILLLKIGFSSHTTNLWSSFKKTFAWWLYFGIFYLDLYLLMRILRQLVQIIQQNFFFLDETWASNDVIMQTSYLLGWCSICKFCLHDAYLPSKTHSLTLTPRPALAQNGHCSRDTF
jgi:hypothetical protein